MRVGLDANPLATPRTGVGHYTLELARHLALLTPNDEFELVSPFPFIRQISNQQLPSNLRTVEARVGTVRRRWFSVGLPLHIRQSGIDLFHGTNYEVPLWSNSPTVLTIHDLSLFLYPQTHEARLVRRGRRRLPIMARRATRIVTPSESVKQELCEHLKINLAKVVVIPEAPRSVFTRMPGDETSEVRRRLGVEDDFILFVGTIEPRKNLVTLLRAYEELLRNTSLNPQLVIAGGEGWLTKDLSSHLESFGMKDRICFTGYLGDVELRALYSSCRVFIYPSLYEGFGLPPLEAMACGAPVITSPIPSVVEGVGVDSARVVSPTDIQALARSIKELLQDENARQRLSIAGRQRAGLLTWERTARATMDVYNELLKR